jgi:hypothetical protein
MRATTVRRGLLETALRIGSQRDRLQMSSFDERKTLFRLLVVTDQGFASSAEDAHRGFFK